MHNILDGIHHDDSNKNSGLYRDGSYPCGGQPLKGHTKYGLSISTFRELSLRTLNCRGSLSLRGLVPLTVKVQLVLSRPGLVRRR